jgi:hypothetical protein
MRQPAYWILVVGQINISDNINLSATIALEMTSVPTLINSQFFPDRQTGDADSAAGDLIPPIDRDQHRSQCFCCCRIASRTSVDTPQSDRLHQFNDFIASCSIVTANQHVTIDVMIKIDEVMGRDVLERRHDTDAVPEQSLQIRNGGPPLRKLHAADFRRHQRYGGVDQYLSLQCVAQRFDGLYLSRKRYGQEHYLSSGDCLSVICPSRARMTNPLVDLASGLSRADRITRTNHDRITGMREPQSQSTTLVPCPA